MQSTSKPKLPSPADVDKRTLIAIETDLQKLKNSVEKDVPVVQKSLEEMKQRIEQTANKVSYHMVLCRRGFGTRASPPTGSVANGAVEGYWDRHDCDFPMEPGVAFSNSFLAGNAHCAASISEFGAGMNRSPNHLMCTNRGYYLWMSHTFTPPTDWAVISCSYTCLVTKSPQ